jgi:hypothetical protein
VQLYELKSNRINPERQSIKTTTHPSEVHLEPSHVDEEQETTITRMHIYSIASRKKVQGTKA